MHSPSPALQSDELTAVDWPSRAASCRCSCMRTNSRKYSLRARLRNPNAVLRDCIIDPAVVQLETPLLEAVSTIASAEFVFVRAHDAAICGIVTTADLSDQFVALARPFLMLGEIEQLSRTALDHTFNSEQFSEAVDPSDDRVVEGAHPWGRSRGSSKSRTNGIVWGGQ